MGSKVKEDRGLNVAAVIREGKWKEDGDKWEGGNGHINCTDRAGRYWGVDGPIEKRDHAGLVLEGPTEGHTGLRQRGDLIGERIFQLKFREKCRHF